MFGKIAAFEFRYQLRQPVFWVVVILFFLLTFGSVTVDQIQIGSGGNVHRNSPFAIAQVSIILTLFYMFVTTAFVANVIVRDVDTGFGPIIRSTRVTRGDYLFGRFLGAFGAAALAFVVVPVAVWLGSLMPWLDPETLGPNQIGHYAFAYFVIALPGVFLTSAAFFTLATVTRSMMLTYVGVVAFFVAWLVATAALDRPEFEGVMAVVEPFGAAAYGLATRYWTAAERNSLMPALEGALLWNRLLWIGVGAALLALAYGLFRFEERPGRLRKAERLRALAEREPVAPAPVRALPKPRFGGATARAQLIARTRFEMGQVFRSPAFFVLLALGLINAIAGLWYTSELYGAPIQLVTRVAISTLQGSFSLIPIIVAIYYAGELVWRERERRTHEIIDSTAVPDWAFVVPKTLAISLVLISTLLISVAAAIAVQALKGYTSFELDKYLLWYVAPLSVDWILLAVLAVFLQSIVPHKFIGWGLMVLYIVASLTMNALGFEHNLYQYAGSPQVPLSDMNGQGDFWIGAAWFRAYWSAFALVLLVLSYGLWRRGAETRLRPRLRRLPRRLAGPAGVIGALALAAFIGTGVWIYTNTNVWNDYRTSDDQERWLADYEKALLQYETAPRPTVVAVSLNLDLYPHEPRLEARGAYELENRTGAPLERVHLAFAESTEVIRADLPGARIEESFDRFNYRILRLDEPMAPGERRTLSFETRMHQRGFRNSDNMTAIVDNGTFLNSSEFTPSLGVTRAGLLQDRAIRRKHGLPEELRPAPLEDVSAQGANYLRADWVLADISVTTEAGQTPIAPGYRVSDVTRDGRRTARFVTESPILHFFSVQSADYEIRRETYGETELAIYFDRQHPTNIDRMMTALRASLDYFEPNFSAYQFRQARIVEAPAYYSFAQSFPNTFAWGEGLGFIADFSDPEKVDYVTYVAAHEFAHQWWAHQIIGADMQGATVLSETLAQYSALMVMERMYGEAQIRKFLKYELDRYLRARGGEVLEELPLIRVENQPYIHYQKGGLVMYLLKDMIGEEAVNRALRRLLERYAFEDAPYPRSADLVEALRAEAGPEHEDLITDLFERITLYDVATREVEVTARPDGRFDVTVQVEARKMYADGQGVETDTPLSELFDVGLFAAEPGDAGFGPEDVILFEPRRIRSGAQTLTFTVDRRPLFVGVDPYNKRIDRNSNDNTRRVAAR